MGAKRNNIIALVTAGVFIAIGLCGSATAQSAEKGEKFARDMTPALQYRSERLLDLDTFSQMNSEANTIILDTRSVEEFRSGHIEGAINMPLSQMTLLNLGDLIDDRETRILLFGNENIAEVADRSDFEISTIPMNLLTYVSLYRYGYEDIYELNESASMTDERLRWTDGPLALAALEGTLLTVQ